MVEKGSMTAAAAHKCVRRVVHSVIQDVDINYVTSHDDDRMREQSLATLPLHVSCLIDSVTEF